MKLGYLVLLFVTMALMVGCVARAPTAEPAAFTTSGLTISPTEADTGEAVTISVVVTNTGGLTGSYVLTLKIANVVVATKDVTLAGGASQTVTFTTAKDVAGTYTVNVNGLSGTLTVKTAPRPAPIHIKWMTLQVDKDSDRSRACRLFMEKVQEEAEGELIFDYIGGPEVMPVPDQVTALSEGVFDMIVSVAHYWERQVPIARAFLLSQLTPQEELEVGFHDIMVEAHKKINAFYLGRVDKPLKFHLFTNVRLEKPQDFSGLRIGAFGKIGTYGGWIAPVEKWGFTVVPITPQEIYSAMQQGEIEGFMYAWHGVSQWRWTEVTKYVISHGLYAGNAVLLLNLDTWNALPKHLQELMIRVIHEVQPEIEALFEEEWEKERQRWEDAGMEFLELSPADAKWYVDTAYEAIWEEIIAKCPELGPKLRELITR